MPRRRPEDPIHRACVQLLMALERQGKLAFFHPANGGGRSKAEAGILKAMGVRAGVYDLVILWPPGRVGFVEVKCPPGPKGGTSHSALSDAQQDWRATFQRLAIPHAVVRDPAELLPLLAVWEVL